MNLYSTRPTEPDPRGPFDAGAHPRFDPAWADQEAGGEAEFSIAGLIQILLANIWIILLFSAIGAGFSAWSFYTQTPRYSASATVVIEEQDPKVVEFRSVLPESSRNYYAMNTEVLLLRSHDLMGRIVDALALEKDPEFNPALRPPTSGWKELIGYDQIVTALGLDSTAPAPGPTPDQSHGITSEIDRIMDLIGLGPKPSPPLPPPDQARETAISILFSKLQVSTIEDTYAFRLTATTEDARNSAAIANAFAEQYVAKKREISFEAINEATKWLSDRVVELKGELEAAEAAVEDFAAGAGVVSEEALIASSLRLQSMRKSQAEQTQAADEVNARIARLRALRTEEEFSALRDALEDPELRALARTLATGPRDAAMLERFDAQFDAQLEAQKAQMDQFEIQAAALSRPIAEMEAIVEAQSADLVQLRQLRREAEAARLVYEYSLRRMKEISVQEGIHQGDVRLLSSAVIPGAPSSSKASSAVARGGTIGLVLGIALIFLKNMLRTSVRTPEELEAATGLTVMGVIPSVEAARPRAILDYMTKKPKSRLAEAIRNLRTAIQLSDMDASPQLIMVTSGLPGEGKTSVAIALAQSWASSGKSVLLLDCDLRRGSLKRQFKIKTKTGLIAVLSANVPFEEAVHHDLETGIDVLIADPTKVSGVDVFGSKSYEAFIEKMRGAYDYIIVDTPPVLAIPDARVIAQNVDTVIYLVQWNATSRRTMRAGLESLYQVKVRVAGLVLTRIDAKRMDRYGYYGFGYGEGERKIDRYYAK